MAIACFSACAISVNAGKYTPITPKVLYDGVYYQYVDDIENNDYTVWVVGYDEATLPSDVVLKQSVRVPTKTDDPTYIRLTPVTGIADSAFMASNTLTTIDIPETIETIGDRAFADCSGLSTVNIGNINIDSQIMLRTMGAYMFENCNGDLYTGLTINFYRFMPAMLDENTFSNAWTNIQLNIRNGSKRVWELWPATQTVELNESIENLEDMFFVFELNPDGQTYNVKAATTDLPAEVVIPVYKYDNPDIYVTSIVPLGFQDCKRLKRLYIPPTLQSIGLKATAGCDSLYYIGFDETTISWFGEAQHLATKDGNVYSKDMTELILKPNASGLSLEPGVTELADYSVPLTKNYSRSVTVPDGVKKIGKCAFWGNSPENIILSKTVQELAAPIIQSDRSLKSVTVDAANPYLTVSNNVIYSKNKTTVIGYAGGSNNGILTIEEGATRIRENAFNGSSTLRGMNIPASMEEIPDNFANDAYNLFGFYVEEDNPFFAHYNEDFLLTKDMTRLIKAGTYVTQVKKPENVSYMEIPEGVTIIGKNAVRRTTAQLISLPESLKEIEDSAFYNSDLISVSIPANVERIGNSAFEKCARLESVTIGSGNSVESCALTSLGENVFAGCQKLTDVKVYSSEPPTAPESAFSNYNATLTVTKGSRSNYQNAGADQAWGNFASVGEHEIMGIENLTDNDMTDGNLIKIVVDNGALTLAGYNGTLPVNVYTPSGMNVCSGYTERIDNLSAGIYLVAVGDKVIKVAVR